MSKRNKIIYWIATAWLSLGMLSTGIVQILHQKEEVKMFQELGYPEYLLTMLGVAKLIGVVLVLVPKTPLLKEWTYAGFFFMMFGAFSSHVIAQHSFGEIFPPVLLIVLTIVSWYFRPADRKLTAIKPGLSFQS